MGQKFKPFRTGKKVAKHKKRIEELIKEKQQEINNMKNENSSSYLVILIYLIFIALYAVNVIKLIKCDFEPSYKEEIIHTIGVVLPPASVFTAFY